MAVTLRFTYTVLDQLYKHGKLNYITGDDGDPAANVNEAARSAAEEDEEK
jgi:hypothetical protein